jgi:molecular chaperone GrpE
MTQKPTTNESLTGNEDFASPDVNDTTLEAKNTVQNADIDGDLSADGLPEMPEIAPEMMEQLEALSKKLQRTEDLEREVAEWKTRYVRLQQDFEGFRNRMSNEIQDAKTDGASSAVETILPMYDDLSRAVESGVKDPTTLIPGVKTVLENFVKALSNLGCEPVPGKGAPFDPHVHEALSVAPGPEDDNVLEVFQTGFTLRGKLVRPARVIVSKRMN